MEKQYQTVYDFKPSLDPKEVRMAPYKRLIPEGTSPEDTEKIMEESESAARYANISPADGRYKKQIQILAPYVNEAAYVRARIIVEALWLRYLMTEILPEGTLRVEEKDLHRIMEFADEMPFDFTLRVGQIEDQRKHDVIGMIEALRERFSDILTPATEGFIHLGITSEDINDLSQKILFTNTLKNVLLPEAQRLVDEIKETATRIGGVIHTLGEKYRRFAKTIENYIPGIFAPDYLTIKFSGATGTHAAMGIIRKGNKSSSDIAKDFTSKVAPNLQYLKATAQINPHDDFLIWCLYTMELAGELERICADIWVDSGKDLWIQNHAHDIANGKPFEEAKRMLFIRPEKNQSGSSAMPQKVQVINVENARGTAQMLRGSLAALIEDISQNRQQRELSDSRKIREIFGDIFPKILHMLQNISKDIAKLEPNESCRGQTTKERWKPVFEHKEDGPYYKGNLKKSITVLNEYANRYADIAILGKTHNQPASPVTLGLVFKTYAERFRYLDDFVSRKKNDFDYTAGNKIFYNLESDLDLYRQRGLLDFAYCSFHEGLMKIDDLRVHESRCHQELESHYECLGEAIQTILRHHQVPNAYDLVKKVTRGTQLNETQYKSMIEDLLKEKHVKEKLPEEAKTYLKQLTPEKFTGEASSLSKLPVK